MDIQERISSLIASVRAHRSADLYRVAWGEATTFDRLPSISRTDLIATPLSRRQYASDIGLVKVVRDERGSFLSQWSFADIAKEPFGSISKRPMVYMADPHEALEKSMWCYEHNMLPVVGERDPDMAMFAAKAYAIDSLLADPASLQAMRPYLSRSSRLASVSIIGSSFNIPELMPFAAYAEEVQLVLALPETGVIATAALSDRPVFDVVADCIVEIRASLVVTKTASLAMPVIKYETGISPRILEG